MFLFRKTFQTFLIISISFGQNLSTAYIKYYLSDRDFVADAPMLASERRGKSHLEVTYNENKQPVMKRWMDENHELIKEEMFVYDNNVLKKRIFLLDNRRTDKIIHYGNREPWSMEFRKYTRLPKSFITFAEQQTEFSLSGKETINEIVFKTIDGHTYGGISLTYDHLGFLKKEVWRILPSEMIVRIFEYEVDIINNIKQVREYGPNGDQISHVALAMAPEDKLYTTPPPRTGNILDEVDIIIKELASKRVHSSVPAFIPATTWDRLMMTNNEAMDIEIIQIDETYVRFTLPNQRDVLSMSLDKVSIIKNRFGELIYP